MKRRNFLKSSALGLVSTVYFTNVENVCGNALDSGQVLSAERIATIKGIDPIVPFLYCPDKEEFMLEQLIEIKKKYGLSRFVFVGPYPEKANEYNGKAYRELGEQIKKAKKKLSHHHIDIGWWGVGLRYNQELGQGFQRIVNIDGNMTMFSYCPLDKRFQQFVSNNVVELINVAHPFVVQFDDDYELSWQPPGNNDFGCFCPIHLKLFERRMGRYYSREELVSIFSEVTPESKRLRRAWAEMSRDSLVELAAAVRKEVDKVAPETRLSLCQAGCSDFDGDFTEAVTRAFAGKTRPMVRLCGTEYSSHQDMGIPETLFHALYSRQHLPNDFECFYEADTAPHIRFYMSASKLRTFITVALSYGLEDLLLYAAQYNETPLEERGYFEMYRKEHKRLSALKEAVRDCEVAGCEIVHNPFSHIACPYPRHGVRTNDWIHVLGRMGISYTTKGGKVKMLSDYISDSLSEEEIKEMLSGGVVLDGQGAYTLFKSGWGGWIGLKDIKPFDASAEVGYGTERTLKYTLTVLDEATVIEKSSVPEIIHFKNNQGGRIAIFALSMSGNTSSQVFNYKMKEKIRRAIEWAGGESLPLFVKNKPNSLCIFNRERTGKYGIATIISICSDVFDSIELDLAEEWKNTTVEQLNQNGQWLTVQSIKNKTGITVQTELSYLSPVILRFMI